MRCRSARRLGVSTDYRHSSKTHRQPVIKDSFVVYARRPSQRATPEPTHLRTFSEHHVAQDGALVSAKSSHSSRSASGQVAVRELALRFEDASSARDQGLVRGLRATPEPTHLRTSSEHHVAQDGALVSAESSQAMRLPCPSESPPPSFPGSPAPNSDLDSDDDDAEEHEAALMREAQANEIARRAEEQQQQQPQQQQQQQQQHLQCGMCSEQSTASASLGSGTVQPPQQQQPQLSHRISAEAKRARAAGPSGETPPARRTAPPAAREGCEPNFLPTSRASNSSEPAASASNEPSASASNGPEPSTTPEPDSHKALNDQQRSRLKVIRERIVAELDGGLARPLGALEGSARAALHALGMRHLRWHPCIQPCGRPPEAQTPAKRAHIDRGGPICLSALCAITLAH